MEAGQMPSGLAPVQESVDNPAFSPQQPGLQRRGSSELGGRFGSGARATGSLSYEGRTRSRSAQWKAQSTKSSSGVIHPRNTSKIYWDGYILLLVWYSVTYELYHTTMGDRLEAQMSIGDWFVDISYWMDIALSFRTGYDEDGRGYRYVMDKRKSAARYLKGWFTVDFVSTFPYALFESTSGHPVSLLRLLRVSRLVRILSAGGNAVDLFNAAVAKFHIRAAYLDILRFLSGILLSIHFLSCLFHLLGVLELMGEISPGNMAVMWSDKEATWLHQYNLVDDLVEPGDGVGGRPPKTGEDSTLPNTDVDVPVPMWTKYLYSTYWAITTVTTIGYGDITPVTNAELVFVCVAELLGMFMFVYTTNSVSALLRGLDAKRTAFQEHLDRIQEYMEARKIPKDLQKRVVQYLTFVNSPKCLTEGKEDELLAPLTGTLREELRMASYVPWLTRNPKIRDLLEVTGGVFTQSASAVLGDYVQNSELEGFVHKLSLQLHSVSAAPYDLIINAADGDTCELSVYFLLTGKVHLYGNVHGSEGDSETESHVICTIDQDDKRSLFGSHELFESTPPPEWCIEAAEYCDLAFISREAFTAAVTEEEEEHNRFHLQHAFPWTKTWSQASSPGPPLPQPEPEPEPELEPPVNQVSSRADARTLDAVSAPDIDMDFENGVAGRHNSHSPPGSGESDKPDAKSPADSARLQPVPRGGPNTPTPRPRRGSLTDRRGSVSGDRRGSVSTGRRMARRRSITSTMHGGGQAVGALMGGIGSGLASSLDLVGSAALDLGGFGVNTGSPPVNHSNVDGTSSIKSVASSRLATVTSADSVASASDTSGGDNDSRTSASTQQVSSPQNVGLELVINSSTRNASIVAADETNGHRGASRAEPEAQHQRGEQRQEWERFVGVTLQSQAMAISAMQGQIGMLSEMMRDANSKMDSLLQLQRASMAKGTAAPVLLEQPTAAASTAPSEPAHKPAGVEAETVIVEGEEGEEDEEEDDNGLAAAPAVGTWTAEQDEADL